MKLTDREDMFRASILLLFFICGCGQTHKKSSDVMQDISNLYSSPQIKVSVYYESGAEPFTGGYATIKYWDLLQKNLEALFQSRATLPTMTVPKELTDMTNIPSNNKSTWSIDDVLSLSKTLPAESGLTFKVIFVNGLAQQGDNIIGFHISGTQIIVIFKDVIKKTGADTDLVPKYVEQSTLVHEMGHALGLVNNGLPMQSPHQDVANGAHCNKTDCVMYYANEGASSMTAFASKAAANLSVVMFDQQCLNDAHAYAK
jgi:predicted Zn-dependent protease